MVHIAVDELRPVSVQCRPLAVGPRCRLSRQLSNIDFASMTMPTLLFHGTSVGWLELSGFQRPSKAFGGADPPHKFIYVCSNPEGARSAAFESFDSVTRRLSENRLQNSDFSFESKHSPPGRFVYEVVICSSARYLDLNSPPTVPTIGKVTWSLFLASFRNLIYGGPIRALFCGVKALFQLCKSAATRKSSILWIQGALRGSCGINPTDDAVVKLLEDSQFDLIGNIHTGYENSYKTVYALIVRVKNNGKEFVCAGRPKNRQVV